MLHHTEQLSISWTLCILSCIQVFCIRYFLSLWLFKGYSPASSKILLAFQVDQTSHLGSFFNSHLYSSVMPLSSLPKHLDSFPLLQHLKYCCNYLCVPFSSTTLCNLRCGEHVFSLCIFCVLFLLIVAFQQMIDGWLLEFWIFPSVRTQNSPNHLVS